MGPVSLWSESGSTDRSPGHIKQCGTALQMVSDVAEAVSHLLLAFSFFIRRNPCAVEMFGAGSGCAAFVSECVFLLHLAYLATLACAAQPTELRGVGVEVVLEVLQARCLLSFCLLYPLLLIRHDAARFMHSFVSIVGVYLYPLSWLTCIALVNNHSLLWRFCRWNFVLKLPVSFFVALKE